jgi:hypothetical protein
MQSSEFRMKRGEVRFQLGCCILALLVPRSYAAKGSFPLRALGCQLREDARPFCLNVKNASGEFYKVRVLFRDRDESATKQDRDRER